MHAVLLCPRLPPFEVKFEGIRRALEAIIPAHAYPIPVAFRSDSEPDDSVVEVGHVQRLWIDDNALLGDIEPDDTPAGRHLAKMIDEADALRGHLALVNQVGPEHATDHWVIAMVKIEIDHAQYAQLQASVLPE